jgi:hypothetical protein
VLVLILVPVMYSFFGESAREDHTDEYADGHAPAATSDVDAAEGDWLPDDLVAAAHRGSVTP